MDSSELETAQLFSNYLINELQKAPMGSIGLHWSSIVIVNSQWHSHLSTMDSKGLQWATMGSNGLQWAPMDSNWL